MFAKYHARARGAGFESDARLATMRGRNAETAGNLAAVGTLLTGAGKAFGAYKSS